MIIKNNSTKMKNNDLTSVKTLSDNKSKDKIKRFAGIEEKLLFMENVTSLEYYSYDDEKLEQVLKDISISIGAGQVCGITGPKFFEINLLLEIMANVKPYGSGKCVLNGIGMMRKKRVILPHIFYIGDYHMLFNNMNVLEYLMFCTNKTGEKAIERQEKLLDLLVNVQLDSLSLVSIKFLTPEQKAVVTLITAILSKKSRLIIFNIPTLKFDHILHNAIARIGEFIKKQNKTLIISTKDLFLIQKACDHIAVIKDGTIGFYGSCDKFIKDFDKTIFYIKVDKANETLNLLQKIFPQYYFELMYGIIIMYDYQDNGITHAEFYDVLSRLNLKPELIKQSKKTIQKAYKEFVRL